jgi:hypothetical protein
MKYEMDSLEATNASTANNWPAQTLEWMGLRLAHACGSFSILVEKAS